MPHGGAVLDGGSHDVVMARTGVLGADRARRGTSAAAPDPVSTGFHGGGEATGA